MNISEMSNETIERANELLEEYIYVLSDILRKNRDSKNFNREVLQKEFNNYILGIDEKTQLDKKKIAIVIMQLRNIDIYKGTLVEQIEYYCYDLVDYKFKLENYLMYDIEGNSTKTNEFDINENIDKFYEKYGKDLVDSVEKKIEEYPDYLVSGNIFSKDELPYVSERFSEGNSEYSDVLYGLNFNGLYTYSGCIGHDEFDSPYIAFKIPEEKLKLFYNFLYHFNKEFEMYGKSMISKKAFSNYDEKEEIICALYSDSIDNREKFYSEIMSALEFSKSHKDIIYDNKYEKSYNLVKKIYEETNGMIIPEISFDSYANFNVDLKRNPEFQEDEIYKEQNKRVLNIYSNIQNFLLSSEKTDIDIFSQEVDDIIEKSNNEEITIPSISQLGIEYSKLVKEENSILEQNAYSLESLADNDERLLELNRLQDRVLKSVDFFYLDRLDEFLDFIDDCIQNKDEEEK